MKNRFLKCIFVAVVALSVVSSCATRRKLANLMSEDSTANVQLALANEADYLPEMKNDLKASRDTLTVKDDDGREFLLMKAVKDEETGETTTYLEDFVYAFADGGLLGIEPVGSVENVSGTLMLAENDKVLDILLGGAAE